MTQFFCQDYLEIISKSNVIKAKNILSCGGIVTITIITGLSCACWCKAFVHNDKNVIVTYCYKIERIYIRTI